MKVLDFLKNKSSCPKCCKVCNIVVVLLICFVVSIIISKVTIKSEVEKVIKNNPKVIIDSVEKYYRDAQQRAREESVKKAPEVAKRLEKTNPTIIGNKNGSKVIVEFFDYACGHCRRQANEIDEVIKKNSDVKVVLADLAIMSQHSLLSAQTGIYVALNNPEKLKSYYSELSKKPINQETIKQVLALIGLPSNYIKLASKDKQVNEIIEGNYNAAREIGLQGTPALIINGKFVGGMITANDIIAMLK